MESTERLRTLTAAIIFSTKREGMLDHRLLEAVTETDALIAALQDIGPVKARYRQARGLPPESRHTGAAV